MIFLRGVQQKNHFNIKLIRHLLKQAFGVFKAINPLWLSCKKLENNCSFAID